MSKSRRPRGTTRSNRRARSSQELVHELRFDLSYRALEQRIAFDAAVAATAEHVTEAAQDGGRQFTLMARLTLSLMQRRYAILPAHCRGR